MNASFKSPVKDQGRPGNQKSKRAHRTFPDIAGVFLSALCVVHCVVFPLLLAPFLVGNGCPSGHLEWLKNETFHHIMLVLTISFGVASVYRGIRNRQLTPVICLTVGLFAIIVAEWFLDELFIVQLPGSLCVIGGHLWAMRGAGLGCEANNCKGSWQVIRNSTGEQLLKRSAS